MEHEYDIEIVGALEIDVEIIGNTITGGGTQKPVKDSTGAAIADEDVGGPDYIIKDLTLTDGVDSILIPLSSSPFDIGLGDVLNSAGTIVGTFPRLGDASAPDAKIKFPSGNNIGIAPSGGVFVVPDLVIPYSPDPTLGPSSETFNPLSADLVPPIITAQAVNTLGADVGSPIVYIPKLGQVKILNPIIENTAIRKAGVGVEQIPPASDYELPDIKLTVDGIITTHLVSSFTYATSPRTLSKDLGSSIPLLTKSCDLPTTAYIRGSATHPWHIERTATKSFCVRWKDIGALASNVMLLTCKLNGPLEAGCQLSWVPASSQYAFVMRVAASSGNLLQVNFNGPQPLKGTWNSLVLSYSGGTAAGLKLYVNGIALTVASIANDTLSTGNTAPRSAWTMNAAFESDNTTFNASFPRNPMKFGEVQFVDKAMSAAEALEFNQRRRSKTSDFSYAASIAHRMLSRDIDMATTTFTGESGANSFTAVNSVTPFSNYDAA